MTKFTPFADDAASMAIDKLTIENGQQQISLYGSLDITRDKAGLQCGFRRNQPSIPTETSHLFRLNPARHSDGSQPGRRCGLRAATFGSGASGLVKSGGFHGAQFTQ